MNFTKVLKLSWNIFSSFVGSYNLDVTGHSIAFQTCMGWLICIISDIIRSIVQLTTQIRIWFMMYSFYISNKTFSSIFSYRTVENDRDSCKLWIYCLWIWIYLFHGKWQFYSSLKIYAEPPLTGPVMNLCSWSSVNNNVFLP
jgi:hypothetical protein